MSWSEAISASPKLAKRCAAKNVFWLSETPLDYWWIFCSFCQSGSLLVNSKCVLNTKANGCICASVSWGRIAASIQPPTDGHVLVEQESIQTANIRGFGSMNGGSQYCLLVTPVTVISRDWKTCFSLLFYRTFFYPFCWFFFFFLPELGWLNLFFRQAKLMAVQKLIVQACVWLPVGEWMWITVRSRFTMTCFFLGTGNGEKAMGECWTLGCIGVPPRHLNLSLYSIQQKAKIILHIRDNSISNVSFCRLKKVYERWQFVKKCQTQRASNGLRVRSNCNSQIPVNSLTKSFTYNLRELWKILTSLLVW